MSMKMCVVSKASCVVRPFHVSRRFTKLKAKRETSNSEKSLLPLLICVYRPQQTRNQKKARLQANHEAEETYSAVPHTLVFHRGQVGKNVGQLIIDIRKVMEPYTAVSLKVPSLNSLGSYCIDLFIFYFCGLCVKSFYFFTNKNRLGRRMCSKTLLL